MSSKTKSPLNTSNSGKRGNPYLIERSFCPLTFVRTLAKAVPTPLSLSCNSFRAAQWVNLSIDPATYTETDQFRHDYLLTNVLKKYDGFELGFDRKELAISSFLETEVKMDQANHRFFETSRISASKQNLVREQLLTIASRKIGFILGDLDAKTILQGTRQSNGASVKIPKRLAHPALKYEREYWAVGKTCLPYLRTAVLQTPSLHGLKFEIVEHNKLEVVPKNSKIDRTIGIEPEGNMYLQLATGSYIRESLRRRAGIDLNNGHIRHGSSSREGSIDGSLATIDLKAASDSLSLGLCCRLLSNEWYDFLLDIRSHSCKLPDGTLHELHKMSSMGNGFTFELESLIFFAISEAVRELQDGQHRTLVFGDDLIIASDLAEQTIDLLDYSGFATNDDKTFVDGPFRESCGYHWFNGTDVKPFYLRAKPMCLPDIFKIANRLRQFMSLDGLIDYRYQQALDYLESFLTAEWRKPRLPSFDLGDGSLVAFPGHKYAFSFKRGVRYVKVMQPVSLQHCIDKHQKGFYTLWLHLSRGRVIGDDRDLALVTKVEGKFVVKRMSLL